MIYRVHIINSLNNSFSENADILISLIYISFGVVIFFVPITLNSKSKILKI